MIYFDNSATTKPYEEVLDSFLKVNQNFYGNPSSLHNYGGKAEQLITGARQQIADGIGVKPTEIIFTSGGTEGNNLAIKGVALEYQGRGNHIITSEIEHSSVGNTLKQLEEKFNFEVTRLPVRSNGLVDPDDIEQAITDKTILVSLIHVNNEVGTVQPVREIGERLKKYPKVLFHVDHVQGAGKLTLPLRDSGIDLCTFSAHKFHGLKGTGFLYKRNGVRIVPLLTGGNQEHTWRSGTENTGGIVAMAKAFRLVEQNRLHKANSLLEVKDYLYNKLKTNREIIIHTPEGAAPHIINFSVSGLKGEVLVHALEEAGFMISTTSACSSKDKTPSPTLKSMGVSNNIAIGAVRLSLSYENTIQEATQFIKILEQIIIRLKKVVG
ncbi:cysteine desulfurase family protein [Lederbergia galactosidilytica]|uniref:Cysteine desulfurase n=1 Tax=Lederbergia galactosidilytica TaxID=217031 RepID=A0A177ZKS3_9BACI|nr:cysteine desulfurase family protein [Lederbergia galactosidilytica]KRG14600.1 cysteine desulfurase [Virgibacillus soli]MBP1915369.1 cysteine desulfurase [Lederbergia galactosidilytica]OAK68183.1 cysteine desulfurase [Lederbergia galactosidilytica]